MKQSTQETISLILAWTVPVPVLHWTGRMLRRLIAWMER